VRAGFDHRPSQGIRFCVIEDYGRTALLVLCFLEPVSPKNEMTNITVGKIPNQDAYCAALGRFVHAYATVEFWAQILLTEQLHLDIPVAKALLNGVRVRDVMSRMRRVREALGEDEDSRFSVELKRVFDQIALISTARDDVLHYGAWQRKGGKGTIVSNWRHAHRVDKLREFEISPEILDNMSWDLELIEGRSKVLLQDLNGDLSRAGVKLDDYPEIWREPWRYKPTQLGNTRQPIGGTPPKRSRQQKSSRK
jgi:hypothetical protein